MLYTQICAHTDTHTDTHTQTYTHRHKQTDTHTDTHTQTHTYTHTQKLIFLPTWEFMIIDTVATVVSNIFANLYQKFDNSNIMSLSSFATKWNIEDPFQGRTKTTAYAMFSFLCLGHYSAECEGDWRRQSCHSTKCQDVWLVSPGNLWSTISQKRVICIAWFFFILGKHAVSRKAKV